MNNPTPTPTNKEKGFILLGFILGIPTLYGLLELIQTLPAYAW